jgi:hypothetical protein
LQAYSDGAIDYSESGSCVHGIEKSPCLEFRGAGAIDYSESGSSVRGLENFLINSGRCKKKMALSGAA